MRFGGVATASSALSHNGSRMAKVAIVREVLDAARPAEVPVIVAWLAGELRQGRLGMGWRSVRALDVAPRTSADPDLDPSVEDVDAVLDVVAAASGPGSVAQRRAAMSALYARLSAQEQEFMSRLLTGELRQGALAGVMIEAIIAASGQPAVLVRRAYMLTGSLPATASLALADEPRVALESVRLHVGRPVAPMLASPAESLDSALQSLGPDVVVDHKLDGARIQVHRDGHDVAVFTRTLNDVTDRVPDLVAAVLALPVTSVILDGETLMLRDDGRPRPFQETMSRFGSSDSGPDAARALRPFFFDCLHLDGADLIDQPLSERLAALEGAAPGLRAPSERPRDLGAAQRVLDAALSAGHEGVMVKSLAGAYTAGRRGKAWQKVKPVHTLDLVVLAAEWGSGRRKGMLSNLHLGARDPRGGPPIMVGKTFKGLTDALLRWQTAEFMGIEDRRDAWTVYLKPLLVVEIELDGAQHSSRYPGGVTLRFARVRRYRPDKTADHADTIDTLRALLP